MDSVIVTGSSGFVGQNLIPGIQSVYKIIKLSLRDPLPERLPEATAIIHLAGKAHDLKNAVNEEEYFYVNEEITKRLFDVYLKSNIKDFIFVSSVKAVADSVSGVLTEDQPPNPQTAYGQSKLKAEQYLLEKNLPPGKRLFIFRPCMIHGPGNKGNLNLLYQAIRKGIPYPLGAFANLRSFLSIDNLLFVFKEVLSRPELPGGVFNLSDDEVLPTTDIIAIIGEAIQKKPRIWKVSPRLIRSLARMGDQLHLPLTSDRLHKLTESYVVSNNLIKNRLGLTQLPVTSRDGLLKTIKSFVS